MTRLNKLIEKILSGRNTSFDEAKNVLQRLGFEMEVKGSHHVFRKPGYHKNVSIKRRAQLLNYQIRDLKEVLRDHQEVLEDYEQ